MHRMHATRILRLARVRNPCPGDNIDYRSTGRIALKDESTRLKRQLLASATPVLGTISDPTKAHPRSTLICDTMWAPVYIVPRNRGSLFV